MSCRAVTLVELVLTIGLAGIIGIPTGLVLGEHLHGAMRARDSTVATQLARAEMERLDSRNNFFLSPDLLIGTTLLPNYLGYPYNLTRVVSCQTGNCTAGGTGSQGIKRIRLTATKPGSTTPLASLVTYRTKHVSFGQ